MCEYQEKAAERAGEVFERRQHSPCFYDADRNRAIERHAVPADGSAASVDRNADDARDNLIARLRKQVDDLNGRLSDFESRNGPGAAAPASPAVTLNANEQQILKEVKSDLIDSLLACGMRDEICDSLACHFDKWVASPAAPTVPTADQNLALVIARLEQIAWNNTDDPREFAAQALVCARHLAARPLAASAVPAVSRESTAAMVWSDALSEVRATVAEMQNNLETFGEYSQETARCVLDGVLDSIDELLAQPYETAELCGYALVPLRVTKEMQAAWDSTPDGEDNDVLFAHAYSRMIAASTKAPIPRWDQLVNWYADQPAVALMVEGMKAENAALRAALTMKDSHAS